VRIGGMGSLFVYYAIQFVVISFNLNNQITEDNPHSFKGLVAIDITLWVVVSIFLICKWLTIQAVDRLIVLFDSVLFALSFSWMVLAAPVADVVVGFFVCNFAITTAIVLLDLWEFRQFSSIYQRMRAGSRASARGGGTYGKGTYEIDVDLNPLRNLEEGKNSDEEGNNRESAESEEAIHKTVAVRSSANVGEVKYMPENINLNQKGVLDGFRVNLSLLPEIDHTIPRDLPWETFEDVVHTVDSSSCHIYTAKWEGTPVILKLIKEDRITSAVAVAEFDIEERVLSRLRHPHIVRLLGSGTQPRKFLVLEYLSGGTLSHSLGVRSDKVKQRWLKKFTFLETLKLANGMAQALNYLHNEWSSSVHIIHRDLKPDNIGWSSDGVLKLFDFGLSVSVRAQRERTEQYKLTGNTGTLRYMAPEVVLGRSYHQSVDTYSFGILIWQVAAGQVPFKDMGKKTYFDKVVIKGVRPPLDVNWPPAFNELLRKCWHEDKNARPSFKEVAAELAELVADEEEAEAARSNNFVTRLQAALLHYVTLLHPVYILISVVLLAVSFILSTQHKHETDNDVSAGAILAAFSGLALYASVVNYLCGAWPLVPLHNPTEKINFDVTAEVGDPNDVIRAQRKGTSNEAPAVEMTAVGASKASNGGIASSLFSAARTANKNIIGRKSQQSGAGTNGQDHRDEAESDDVEIGFNTVTHAYLAPPPAPVPADGKSKSGKGILAGLQEKVARGTGRASKQSKRSDGAGNVIFSPLSNMHDEEADED